MTLGLRPVPVQDNLSQVQRENELQQDIQVDVLEAASAEMRYFCRTCKSICPMFLNWV